MALPSEKPEFPPLLPLGRHAATLDEIQATCVDAFPLSQTRQKIMDGLRAVVARLTRDLVACELWIDGSFLTEKIDADDCDLVCRVRGEFYDSATEEQKATVDWVFGNLRDEHLCHSFGFFEYDVSSPNYWLGEYSYCYWMKQWGFSRESVLKGIAVIVLDGTMVVEPKAQEGDHVA